LTRTLFTNAQVLRDAADLKPWNGTKLLDVPRREMLVESGRIVRVANSGDIPRDQCDETFDLGGRFVMPGFVEPHGHLFWTGVQAQRVALGAAQSLEDIVKLVAKGASSRPRGSWILGEGWDQTKWRSANGEVAEALPSHELLSRAVPDHPVLLMRVDGHAALCNSAAFKVAGITRSAPDPEGGVIARDHRGEPSGILLERAMEMVMRLVPPLDRAARRSATRSGLEILARYGVTTFHECGANAEEIAVLEDLRNAGELTCRMHVMLDGGEEELVRTRLERGPEHWDKDGMLQVRAIKMFADGALGSRGALLMEPYADQPDTRGVAIAGCEALVKVGRAALERGFQLAVHAIGDAANRIVLDAYEEILAGNTSRDHRFRVEHAQLLAPDDVPRFAKLGVIASMQACHCTADLPWLAARLGTRRAEERGYLWRSLVDSGAVVINGSDTPVEPPNPFFSFHAAITRRRRKDQDGDREPFVPGECLLPHEALASAGHLAAWAGFGEAWSGALAPGLGADFIVLKECPFTADVDQLTEAIVEETWVAGRRVHGAGSSSGQEFM